MFRYLHNVLFGAKKDSLEIPSPEEELIRRLKPYEKQLYKIQDIIAWRDLPLSSFTLLSVNLIFWFVSYFEWRFLGILFTIISIMLIYDAWVNYIWPEIRLKNHTPKEVSEVYPEGVFSLPELSRYTTEIQTLILKRYSEIRNLRSSQPTFFFVGSSVIWLLFAVIGSFFSGMALIYLLTMMLLTLPGVYIHLVNQNQKLIIKQILHSIYFILMPPESCKNVDEYVPDTSVENLEILAKAGANSNDLSTPSSDSSVVDLIPEHDESSVDTVEDSFKLPSLEKIDHSETDSEADVLSFKNTHFNGNSSEDDASLVRDLSFPDIGSFSMKPSGTSGFTSAISGVIYKTFPTISGRLQFKATGEEIVASPLEEDSDSEFEIIDENS